MLEPRPLCQHNGTRDPMGRCNGCGAMLWEPEDPPYPDPDLDLALDMSSCTALRVAQVADQAAMLDLMMAAQRLGQNTRTTCSAMLLALKHVGDAMPECERRDLAHSAHMLSTQLAAPQTVDGQ